MSLNIVENYDSRAQHPVDIVEQLAGLHGWSFDRAGDDEITITVGGGWADYQISFTWLDEVEALHLACAFSINMNHRREAEMFKLITLINEQLWVGHFGLWNSEKMVIFRHAMVLSGGAQATPLQCETVLQAAIAACERYYQSFQFVLWSGKSAQEGMDCAMFETKGQA